jgi:hypothetical protein
MSSSFAWVDPAAKTAAAPKQVESRNLRIENLPAKHARITHTRAQPLPSVGTRLAGTASGSVTALRSTCPAELGQTSAFPLR